MCEKCLAAHESWPANKKHSMISIKELTQPENQARMRRKPYCMKDENNTLKFYCKTCRELVCTHCMVLNHIKQNHSCLAIEEVAEKQKEELRFSCVVLDEKLAEGNEAIKVIRNIMHEIENNAKKVTAQIIRRKQQVLEEVT